MLSVYVIPDRATVPVGYSLPAELTARGLPTQWVDERCDPAENGVRLSFYDQPYPYDLEEDGGDVIIWNPDTRDVRYLSRGDVEAVRRAIPGTPLTHLRYSYYILTEDMDRDLDALQCEGLTCQICASHLDGTDSVLAVDVLDLYGEFNNPVYPGEMIVYADGVLYETIPEEVVKAVRSTS